jgi:hypothetical protein
LTQALALAFGFPCLALDDVALNPEIAFLILRTILAKRGDTRDCRTRTNLLWESTEGGFHGMPLLTDAIEVAARIYGNEPGSQPGP